jgi:hypothetical protein
MSLKQHRIPQNIKKLVKLQPANLGFVKITLTNELDHIFRSHCFRWTILDKLRARIEFVL